MIKQIQRIERLHQLIKLNATGSPQHCAELLEISERQLYNTLDLMKALGAPIYYDIALGSYSYEREVVCSFGFLVKNTDDKITDSQLRGSKNL
ncbi:MAG: hypothetical protein JJ978_04720 [Roseivirga sp.]|jgi:hypothetical protein|uniref:hypothetical protein n=1 Tax=Roseivirga sp. TaxID=1964215 RepID=UPI001B0C361D|nr:hypothetical protein [Roseivirga sp.]MBO6494850.1 hypothetical protein [Roseivirga sp.]